MEQRQNKRTQQTRGQIREAAQRLFLQNGYLATSTDAILAEAGIASKETLYRHYPSKEELFVDVIKHLTLEQPHFTTQLAELPEIQDLPTLHQALTTVAREIFSLMCQPEYPALLRIVIAEMPRVPQLSPLFRDTVPKRGLSIITSLLQQARERNLIDDLDFDAVAHALIGGLLTYALVDFVFTGDEAQPPHLNRADAVVEVIMRSLVSNPSSHINDME